MRWGRRGGYADPGLKAFHNIGQQWDIQEEYKSESNINAVREMRGNKSDQ